MEFCSCEEAFSCLKLIENGLKEKKINFSYLDMLYQRLDNIILAIRLLRIDCSLYGSSLDCIIETLNLHKQLLNYLQSNSLGKISLECNMKEGKRLEHEKIVDDMILKCINSDSLGFNNIVGMEEAKQTLMEACIFPVKYPHLFQGAIHPWSRILLFGPPGTGKTLLVKALASELGRNLFYVSSASLLSSWIGESEKLIQTLFRSAKAKCEECLIFIDEIDSLCRIRSHNEDEHSRRVKTELLRQLEGASNFGSDEIFVLAATNCPWDLDPAFLRRFQRRIFVNLPKRQERKELLEQRLGSHNSFIKNISEWDTVLDMTEGYSGADLTNLITATLFRPIRELQTTRYWKITNEKIIPASQDDKNSIHSTLENFPSHKVSARPVKMDDFLQVLNSTPRTVSEDMMKKYFEFTNGCY